MKSKEVFGLLINPFTKIAGIQAFGLGLVFMVLMGIVGAQNGVAFDGVVDIHFGNELTLYDSFLYLAIDLVCLIAVMWAAGQFVAKNFRLIDLLGTMTLAKAPMLLMALAGYFIVLPDSDVLLKDPTAVFRYSSVVVVVLLSLPIMIWNIALMYHAFRVSCDVKGIKLGITITLGILAAEILSKLLIVTLA